MMVVSHTSALARAARELIPTATRGAAAGAIATAAMSVVFALGDRSTTSNTKPPRLLVDRFAPRLPDDTADRVALALHFAYGIAAGKVYALLIPKRSNTVLSGIGYGVLVWAIGYEGWMCALRVLPPAHRDHRPRALTILAAHAVYGAVLGPTVGALSRASRH